ncbi:ImmA/IrrE family metallo-endopeptidase [Robinsoniella sp. KNHs210]|nr:ImmA/IrrE family metallo-endopeptidase [Robinsoniella sp. KNHs210]
MRLVMAHELGHAIMHSKENCYFLEHHTLMLTNKNEVEANRFAVNLLISDDELSDYKEFTVDQISRITGYGMKLIELRMKDYGR